MYRWPAVGWCFGRITKVNTDGRYKIDGKPVNFFVYYEIDANESRHSARSQRLWTLHHVGLARWLCESVCESGHWVSGGTKAFLGVPSFLIPSGHSVAMVF